MITVGYAEAKRAREENARRPRTSKEESTQEQYLELIEGGKYRRAAEAIISEGYLLPEESEILVNHLLDHRFLTLARKIIRRFFVRQSTLWRILKEFSKLAEKLELTPAKIREAERTGKKFSSVARYRHPDEPSFLKVAYGYYV